MTKWIERAAIVAIVAAMAVACLGLYVQWRDCEDSGGVAVRGVFWLECIKR